MSIEGLSPATGTNPKITIMFMARRFDPEDESWIATKR
jgi:hypothetical protein